MRTHPAAEIFPMLQGAEFDALVQDISEHGLREPIVLHDGVVLDGRNRLRACKAAKVEPRFIEWDRQGSPVEYVISLNLKRRHLSPSEQAMVGAQALPMFEEEARQRQEAGRIAGGQARHGENSLRAKLPATSCDPSRARDHAATLVGVSPRSIEHAKRVLEHGTPELVEACKTGKIAVSSGASLTKTSEQMQRAVVEHVHAGEKFNNALRKVKGDEIKSGARQFPDGKFRVIYADPPWQYGDTRATLDGYSESAADAQYPTMPTDEICNLPVADLAADDCVLLCWATFPMLEDGLRVVNEWGFSYKTAFVWNKLRPNLGHYHQANAEILLVATRGSCAPNTDKREKQVQDIERTGRHSEKPEAFREMIDRMWVGGPRIELFRRGEAPDGWTVWGNESR